MKLKTKRVEVGYALPRQDEKHQGIYKVTLVDIDIGDPEWCKNAEWKTRIFLDDNGQKYEAVFTIGLAPGEKEKVMRYLNES